MNLFKDPVDDERVCHAFAVHRSICISRLTDEHIYTTGGYHTSAHVSGGHGIFPIRPRPPLIAWRSTGPQLDGAAWEDIGNPTNHPTHGEEVQVPNHLVRLAAIPASRSKDHEMLKEALKQGDVISDDGPWPGPWIVGRPKVFFKEHTNKLVM